MSKPSNHEDCVIMIEVDEYRFLNYDTLVSETRFPRCSHENRSHNSPINTIDRNKSFLIFVSHVWLLENHPDNIAGEKYSLCIDGIRKLRSAYAPRVPNCYVWIDYSCIMQPKSDSEGNRESDESRQLKKVSESEVLLQELERYDEIVKCCDCIFTPIVDPHHHLWNFPCRSYFETRLFGDGPRSYLNRAWCRMEMMYAAIIPVADATSRSAMFRFGLSEYLLRNRRPHFVYSTKQMLMNALPFIMPPLKHKYFEDYNPLTGFLTKPEDKAIIVELYNKLLSNSNAVAVQYGYDGECRNGLRQGKGKMVYDDGSAYEGDWMCDRREGEGVQIDPQGSVYVGYWSDNCRSGNGILYQAEGDVYVGGWENDRRNGLGKLSFVDGCEFDGEWKDDMKSGQGRFTNPNGSEYNGSWENDLKHGKGVLISDDGKFTGHWVADKRNGHGEMHYCSGQHYAGDWKDDMFHGYGSFTGNSGFVYHGDWRHGKKSGQGVSFHADGEYFEGQFQNDARCGYGRSHRENLSTYEGMWVNNEQSGSGKCVYFTAYGSEEYKGEWLNGRFHGSGTYLYSDESTYVGEWKNGVKSGYGRYCYKNGDKYEGDFENDKRHGYGVFSQQGGKYDGNWANDCRHGEGTYWYNDGWVDSGLWIEDKLFHIT